MAKIESTEAIAQKIDQKIELKAIKNQRRNCQCQQNR